MDRNLGKCVREILRMLQPILQNYHRAFLEKQKGFAKARPPWLVKTQEEAFQHFETLGFPTPKNEDWKYLRLETMPEFVLDESPPVFSQEALHAAEQNFSLDSHQPIKLIFVNGRLVTDLSQNPILFPGLEIRELSRVIKESPEKIKPFLDRTFVSTNPFYFLNTAFLENGIFIHLKPACHLESPIQLIFFSSGNSNTPTLFMRTLVLAERDSHATFIETYMGSEDKNYVNNVVSQLHLEEGAVLDHYKLQEENSRAFHVGLLNSSQKRGSHFSSHSISLGGLVARHDIASDLLAPLASCVHHGLFLGHDHQQVDHHTCIDHRLPQGTSRTLYKGILDDHARGIFNGKVIVHPGAVKTDSNQTTRNLLLSKNAEVDPKPELEIEADDVKCSHGATVGQLDENAIYYLRTRGLAERDARDLLIKAFASEVIEKFNFVPLRCLVNQIVHQKLARMGEKKS